VTPDLRLHDAEQLAEIELYSAMVIAASAHEGPLTIDEVDEILGLRPAS
jgi:hypothetical protein